MSFNEDDDIDDIEKKKHFVGLGRKKKNEEVKGGILFGKKPQKAKMTAIVPKQKEDDVIEMDHTHNLALMDYVHTYCKVWEYLEYCAAYAAEEGGFKDGNAQIGIGRDRDRDRDREKD
mmetsp:Transcript_106461/g.229340  ORF Transcript_106461/g.229340 Transcript_106461/m.229340 type:complete len:118 (+) Transcript_106461:1085-1438(+)|eukprot:CAMPEP_0116896038 /NCGR_PEP_ID=MMETSP0467-20121206/5386_1 /TAXON_ID=283647 /ORGANISM="Mesodinium pulex, Strain SPMC105" /LENGTH=117 /DNA_ID=CAMNT_0004567017 /DNA_START=46 /DNA_END=399 /DNA_ORIENTATION=+